MRSDSLGFCCDWEVTAVLISHVLRPHDVSTQENTVLTLMHAPLCESVSPGKSLDLHCELLDWINKSPSISRAPRCPCRLVAWGLRVSLRHVPCAQGTAQGPGSKGW